MRKLTINIDMSGFHADCLDGNYEGAEVARILNHLVTAYENEDYVFDMNLHDIDGNSVGAVEVSETT